MLNSATSMSDEDLLPVLSRMRKEVLALHGEPGMHCLSCCALNKCSSAGCKYICASCLLIIVGIQKILRKQVMRRLLSCQGASARSCLCHLQCAQLWKKILTVSEKTQPAYRMRMCRGHAYDVSSVQLWIWFGSRFHRKLKVTFKFRGIDKL